MTESDRRPWRTGRKVGRTLYIPAGVDTDELIGMVSPELAELDAARAFAVRTEADAVMCRVDVTPDQLAQARGCEPDNTCYGECVEVAREHLEEDPEDAVDDDQLECIAKQAWH